eukprot:CAMPEP_0202391418 /NCGR_PEP_ID=MMETSP1127-20130417/91823_1 /ASSEMBLY_ACC=CAM_ASM_000462 /TAXON_ID=3047 /ORGANISM="Dunaliella tertiolecta, Strain CCMP1320" /LENGTH=277 /DNA_ID=CAMNT_0048993847 /DNA_START=105 /DNA_END=939 /DNA_ORIENTATION=-
MSFINTDPEGYMSWMRGSLSSVSSETRHRVNQPLDVTVREQRKLRKPLLAEPTPDLARQIFSSVFPNPSSSSRTHPEHQPKAPAPQEHQPQAPAQTGLETASAQGTSQTGQPMPNSSSRAHPEHQPKAPAPQEHQPQAPAQTASGDNKRKREPQGSTSREVPEHQPVHAVAPAPQEHQSQRALASARPPREIVPVVVPSFVMEPGQWEVFKQHRGVDDIRTTLCRRSAANFASEEEQQKYAVELVSFLVFEGALPHTPTPRKRERDAARNLKQRANT